MESLESFHVSPQQRFGSCTQHKSKHYLLCKLACRHKQANRNRYLAPLALVCYTATMAACATGYGLNDSMKKLYKEVSVQLQMLQLLGLLTHMAVEVACRFAGR